MDRRIELKPPMMGAFDIRECTLVVSIVNIVIWSLAITGSIYLSCFITKTQWKALWFFITVLLYVGFIVLNMKLRTAVIERNIAPVLFWLQTYITLFLMVIFFILTLVNIIEDKSSYDGDANDEKILLITLLILEVFWAFSIYTVYQYLNFETKSCTWALNILIDAESFSLNSSLTQQHEEYYIPK